MLISLGEPTHRVLLWQLDDCWHYEVDLAGTKYGGCGTKPTLEEALASLATMIPRLDPNV